MSWLRFTAVGWCYALAIEVVYKLFARWNPGGLFMAAIFYVVYLQLVYGLYLLLKANISDVARRSVVFLVLGGFLGLFVLEWWLVGNTPWGRPNASQFGMFVVHSCYPVMAMLAVESGDAARRTRSKATRFFLTFMVVLVLLGVLIPNAFLKFAWFIYGAVVGYLGLWYFFLRYVREVSGR